MIGVNLAQDFIYSTRSTSLAGFGQISWKPGFAGDKLELTGGTRYTHDKRSVDVISQNAAAPVPGGIPPSSYPLGPSRSGEASFNNWSFLGSASYQWTPRIMTYARFSTGYKAGGFYPRASPTQDLTFKPEKATAYEIGFKTETADRKLRLNGALFYTKYSDLQVPQFTGGATGFVPSANATYKGFELELLAVPTRDVQIDASIGYVDPKYDRFQITPTIDIKSTAKFPYVPKLNAHAGAQYSIPVSIGRVVLRGDYAYQGKRWYFTDVLINPLNDALAASAEHLVSARISLTDVQLGAGRVTLSVFGENLLNQVQRPAGIDFGPAIGIAGTNFGLPRTWGAEAVVKF